MLKILADECIHNDLVEALKEEGFDVSNVIKNTTTFFKSEGVRNLKGKLAIIGKKKVRIRSFL